MVSRGLEEKKEAPTNKSTATTGSKVSNRYHYFSRVSLNSGSQRDMSCTTVANNDAAGASNSGDPRQSIPAELTALRHQASCSYQRHHDQEAIPVVRKNEDEEEKQKEECKLVRSWNLRKRRTECKAAVDNSHDCSSPARVSNAMKLPRRNHLKNTERVKFSVALSSKEIEEDFMAMLGRRPPGRPKKRPRAVQKELNNIFPGLSLMEITADMYKVPETKENHNVFQSAKRKRKRNR